MTDRMLPDRHQLLLHPLVACNLPMMMDLDIARSLGFDGIEASHAKIRAFLDAGNSEAELAARMRGVNVPGMGFLCDIERQGAEETALLREAERMFHEARLVGARGVQVLTGPVDVRAVIARAEGRACDLYPGVLGLPRAEQMALTARGLARLADLAAGFGLVLYLEALAWTPLNRLADQVELIARAGRDNLRLVVDFWHCFIAGDTPDAVARLDPALIYGVHICDSRRFGGGIPVETELRDVPAGEGVIDLQAWADAVKATGYTGWWSAENFCRREHQENGYEVARRIHALMVRLVLG